jgi:hypothetical protein
MKSPQELFENLKKDELFQQWSSEHPNIFLSHFFSPLSSDFVLNSEFEIGFFDSDTAKITVFVSLKNGFEIKPADDVFKKPDEKVESLKFDEVKLSFEEALKIFKEESPKQFPSEQLGGGFVILQTYQNKTIWNFTFITKKLKFINLKINAISGKVEDKQNIDLVQK